MRVVLRSSSCSVRNWWRSSSAENSSSASGLTLPSSASARSAAAQPLCLLVARRTAPASGSPVVAVAGLAGEAARAGRGRTRRPAPRSRPSSSSARSLELLDPHPLLGAGHLVAVHGVGELRRARAASSRSAARTASSVCLARRRGPPRPRSARSARPVERRLEPGQDHGARRRRPPCGRGGLAAHAAHGARRPGPARRARPSAARSERVGAAVQRAGALLAGAQREPGLHLGLRAPRGRLGQPLARRLVSGSLVGGVARPRPSRCSSSASPRGRRRGACLGGRSDRRVDPLGLRRAPSARSSRGARAARRRRPCVASDSCSLASADVDPAAARRPLALEPC